MKKKLAFLHSTVKFTKCYRSGTINIYVCLPVSFLHTNNGSDRLFNSFAWKFFQCRLHLWYKLTEVQYPLDIFSWYKFDVHFQLVRVTWLTCASGVDSSKKEGNNLKYNMAERERDIQTCVSIFALFLPRIANIM